MVFSRPPQKPPPVNHPPTKKRPILRLTAKSGAFSLRQAFENPAAFAWVRSKLGAGLAKPAPKTSPAQNLRQPIHQRLAFRFCPDGNAQELINAWELEVADDDVFFA